MIENFLLSLGSRHNVEPRNPNTQTQQKVCVVMKQSAELRAREGLFQIIFRGQDWGQKSPHHLKLLISFI